MGLSAASHLWACIAGHFQRRSATMAPPHRRSTGYLDPAAFAGAVVEMVRRGREPRARLYVFSLRDFRRAVGGKWERLGGLVETAVDGIVGRHIDINKAAFTRLDGEISCLTLPRTSRGEARACVAAIARDLSLQLVGDAVIGGRRPQVVAANLPLRSAVTPAGALDRQAIEDAVNRAGATLAADEANAAVAASAAVGTSLAAPHRATLAALLAKDDDAALPPPVFAIGGGAKPRTDPGTVPDWLDEQLSERAAAALTKESRMAPETNLTLVWTPVWVTNRRGLGAFQARIIRADPTMAAPLEGVHAYSGAAPIEALTLDRFVATQAARELLGLFLAEDQQRMGLTVPIHWMSLAPRWRDCVRMPFEDCPATARRRLLKIEVFGLNPAIPASILKSLMDPLELLGCDVLARVPLAAPEMVRSLPSVKAIGIDLAELGDDDRVGDDELFARLLDFRDAARRANTACYVWSVRRRILISRIVEAGFSLVNGPGLMCDLGRPALHDGTLKAA